ncbi:MAG: butyrate kinase [Paludibacter sp.]|jgi:butyrate kinase|nr:butyrate kinase [Paludibacter sp.]
MYKILVINPGSTSTKIAVFGDEEVLFTSTVKHSTQELQKFKNVIDQYEFRRNHILENLEKEKIDLTEINVVVGRGGLLRPLQSGVYEVNERMINDLRLVLNGEHASNLGAILAQEIARKIPGCKAFIADPVVVDELQDVARISGLPQFPRRSSLHALNHKAIGRKYAADMGTSYEALNLVIAHMGGGISVAAHRLGRVIDTNQALDGFGPFSPQRAGTMDAGALIRVIYAGIYEREEIQSLLVGKGGLVAHLGTNDVNVAYQLAINGDFHARLVLEAMAYGVAKEIGSMLAVLEGKADAVVLTGGIAYNELVVNYITRMISPICKVAVYPGEDEMRALAQAGLRVMNGQEIVKHY